jgi:transcriptional regulator with PAS, ATPase and Fis domain
MQAGRRLALRGRPAARKAGLRAPGPAAAIEQLKRRMIEDALRECGSKTRAAERLGISRQSLQQMLRRRST